MNTMQSIIETCGGEYKLLGGVIIVVVVMWAIRTVIWELNGRK